MYKNERNINKLIRFNKIFKNGKEYLKKLTYNNYKKKTYNG